jgi:hypothetical protein
MARTANEFTKDINVTLSIPESDLEIFNGVIGEDLEFLDTSECWEKFSVDSSFFPRNSNHSYETPHFEVNGSTYMVMLEMVSEDLYSQAILYQIIEKEDNFKEVVEISYTDAEYDSFSGEYFIPADDYMVILDVS